MADITVTLLFYSPGNDGAFSYDPTLGPVEISSNGDYFFSSKTVSEKPSLAKSAVELMLTKVC